MRTTVMLAPDLFRRAKTRSAERGESLKALITRALAAELGAVPADGNAARARVQLPLFGTPRAGAVVLRNDDVARHLADADAAAIAPDRRPRRRRP